MLLISLLLVGKLKLGDNRALAKDHMTRKWQTCEMHLSLPPLMNVLLTIMVTPSREAAKRKYMYVYGGKSWVIPGL